jgi:hypothetical protein
LRLIESEEGASPVQLPALLFIPIIEYCTMTSKAASKSSEKSSVGAGTSVDGPFCDTRAIVQRMLPPSFVADEKAVALIDKCVQEFASSVANIAGGYCVMDHHTFFSAYKVSKPNEVKSDHVLRTLENMGFVDFVKPLTTYKQVLKNKQPQPVISRPPVSAVSAMARGAGSSSAGKTKTQANPTDGPPNKKSKTSGASNEPYTGKWVPGAAIIGAKGAIPVASSSAALHKPPGALLPGASALSGTQPTTLKAQKERLVAAIDHDLLTANPPLTEKDLCTKFGVGIQQLRNRIAALRAKQLVPKGLLTPVVATAPRSVAPRPAPAFAAPTQSSGPVPRSAPSQSFLAGVQGALNAGGAPSAQIPSSSSTLPGPPRVAHTVDANAAATAPATQSARQVVPNTNAVVQPTTATENVQTK